MRYLNNMSVSVEDFDYNLRPEMIAYEPHEPRDECKLLVYKVETDELIVDKFINLGKYLPNHSTLVLNNTKVAQARIVLTKPTGGKIELLVFVEDIVNKKKLVRVLADRQAPIDRELFFNQTAVCKVINQDKEIFFIEVYDRDNFLHILEQAGTVPIPTYLRSTQLSKDELQTKYQTIFAKKLGSAAAPTASLHFTDRVFESLNKSGASTKEVTLHVGYGTFATITDETVQKGKLHQEYYEVEEAVWKDLKNPKEFEKPIIAVGTTAVRTVESVAQSGKLSGETDIFIKPGYDFKMVDGLITNFHVPKSSLLMLVQAFLEYKGAKRDWKEIYDFAIANDFKFLSFGDAMVII